MIEITDAAFDRIARKTEEVDEKGIRVALKGGGCAGFEYTFDYCTASQYNDTTIDMGLFKVFIDDISIRYLSGATLDFVKDGLQEEFVWRNPNEQGHCGCGVSAYF
tara:strand:+ start:767 stop:1084 length:318 start_codon:yes stop_codon:yes gene_type:complete